MQFRTAAPGTPQSGERSLDPTRVWRCDVAAARYREARATAVMGKHAAQPRDSSQPACHAMSPVLPFSLVLHLPGDMHAHQSSIRLVTWELALDCPAGLLFSPGLWSCGGLPHSPGSPFQRILTLSIMDYGAGFSTNDEHAVKILVLRNILPVYGRTARGLSICWRTNCPCLSIPDLPNTQ